MSEEERRRKALQQYLINQPGLKVISQGRMYTPVEIAENRQRAQQRQVQPPQRDTRSNVSKFFGGVREFAAAPIRPFSEGLTELITQGTGFGTSQLLEAQRRESQQDLENTLRFANLSKTAKFGRTGFAAANNTNQDYASTIANSNRAQTTADKSRFLGSAAQVATLPFLGAGRVGAAATGRVVAGKTIPVASKAFRYGRNAAEGVGQGVLTEFSDNKDPTLKGAVIKGSLGGVLGGVAEPTLGVLGKAIGKVTNSTSRKIARSNNIIEIAETLSKKYPDADPDALASLANSLTGVGKARDVKRSLRTFERSGAEEIVTYSGGTKGGTAFSTPDREFAELKFAQEIPGGTVTKRTLKKSDVLDTRNPAHRAKLESLLGKEQTDRLIGRSDNGLPAHAEFGEEDALRDAADKLGFKHVALSETDKQTKYNGRDVVSYADAQPAPKPETKVVASGEAAPTPKGTPSQAADLEQADLTKLPDDVQQKINNGEAITPEDMGKISKVPGTTKAKGVAPETRNLEVDRAAQDALKRGSFDEAVAIYMKQGMDYGEAQEAARRLADKSGLDDLGRLFVEGEPRTVDGKAIKNPDVKDTMKNLSAARAISETDARLASATIERAAKQYGVDTSDIGFIERYQSGQLTDPDEIAFGNVLKQETDRIFELQKQIDPSIEYRKNYLPQSYAQDATQVDEAVKQLQTRTNAANPRQFRTYEEARQYGLAPRFQNIEQMVGESAGSAQNALANKAVVENGLEQGLFSTRQVDRNWKVVEGFSQKGAPVYASSKVANVINNALQESTDALSKGVRGLGKVNATWQDIMLSGGVPYTPANFFVFGQVVKEFTAGRVGVVKDFVYSMSDNLTQKRFVENADFVRKLADRGLTFNIKSHVGDIDESWLANKWGKAMNKATFQRFMPNQYLSIAENIYKKTGDLDLAADTVKKYYGIVDQIAKGRSTNVQNGINAAFFAPRYRESIINSLINTGKSISPTTWGDAAYNMNRRLAGGMAVTVVAAEMLQRQISGHGLLENRNGQEASIEIALGGKDEKGNQKVVNIPLMPGFLTLPRAALRAVQGAVNGDIVGGDPNKPSVVGEFSKVLSTPLQVAGQVINNADYFGRPIYNNEEIANQEGIEPDSTASKFGKVAKYVGFQGMPGYGRAVRDAINGKSGLEVAAQAGELPLRFGKRLNPETTAYFKDRDEVYNSLDKNGKAVWDAIHPKVKNINGEYMTDPTVDSALARAANYLDNDNVRKAEVEMARRAKARGQKVDPLWELDDNKQRIALRIQTLPPNDPQKDKLKKDNPWYSELSRNRSAFFDGLPAGDPNKPKSPVDFPEPDAKTASLVDAYYQLEDSTMRRDFLKQNPEVTVQFAKQDQYNRAVRAAKDLPQYDKYPEASPEVQRLNDFYASLPKGEGKAKRDGTASSPARSAWIKNHPNEWALLTDYWSKTAQWQLQNDAEMANFEGEDLSEKGIKSIASLANNMGGGTGGFQFARQPKTPGEYWIDENGEYHKLTPSDKKKLYLANLLPDLKTITFKAPDINTTPQKRVFKVNLPTPVSRKKSRVKIRL